MVTTFFDANGAVIPPYFQRVLFRMLVNKGINASSLLDKLDIPEATFLNDACKLTVEQHKQFIKNALNTTEDSQLGWHFGQQIDITNLGLLGYTVMASENGESAVNTLTRFFKLRAPSYDLTLSKDVQNTGIARLQINENFDFGEVRYFMLSCIVSAFDHIFTDLNQASTMIKRVEFSCDEPQDWHQQAISVTYPIIFKCPSNTVYLDAHFLKQPFPTADADTEKVTTKICQEMLSKVEDQSGIKKELSDLLNSCEGPYPTLVQAADILCLSPRTFRRELQKLNTSFQVLLDEARTTKAKALLLNTRKTTAEISFELGFKDPSNFNRAFKKWTGISPGKYRH